MNVELLGIVMYQVRHLFLGVIIIFSFELYGCATIRTMPSLAAYGSPKIYSGTRLDIYSIMKNESGLKKFKVEPPEYPLFDLPFSFVLDTAILPTTYPVAAYEFLFYRKGSMN